MMAFIVNLQKYDSKKMFQLAEDFFVGLGLDKMTDTFWSKSMRDKPEGKEVVCHASAEDFFIGPTPDQREDFRYNWLNHMYKGKQLCTLLSNHHYK